MSINVKSVYDEPKPSDGLRILVDRLWPRGLSKDAAAVELWIKDLAPSPTLRRWFGHEPVKFTEFKSRYLAELAQAVEERERLLTDSRGRTITLVYATKDADHNNAVVLRTWLETPAKQQERRHVKSRRTKKQKGENR